MQQQGQLDWGQLAALTYSASAAVITRVSNSNLEPLTVTTGVATSANFRLSRQGEDRLTQCVQSLTSQRIGQALWFGFGVKHVVRQLAETNHGMATIALCGALSEVMPAKLAARILDELSLAFGAPQDLRPSLQQLECLTTALSGVLSTSSFGLIADHFMRLSDAASNRALNSKTPDFGDPKDVAKVLISVTRLSRGDLGSIEVHGGPACGWIAAFAS